MIHAPLSTRRRTPGTDRTAPAPQSRIAAPATRPAATHGCACGGGCPRCAPAPAPTRLPMGRPGDPLEREADRVTAGVLADLGMRPARPASAPVVLPGGAAPNVEDILARPGQPLDAATRGLLEPRFGADFSGVRVHADAAAGRSAASLRARAYTVGSHVVFGAGEYAPDTPVGRTLLTHELTHTIQQGGAAPVHGMPGAVRTSRTGGRRVQGGFWDDVWSGIQSVGRAIGSAFEWVGERIVDAGNWMLDLLRELPARLLRLGRTLLDGFVGIVTFIPDAIRALASGGLSGLGDFLWDRALNAGGWLLTLLSRVFDVLSGPEALEFVTHLVTRATPLTGAERAAAQSVLGPNAIDWDRVRVAESGVLSLVFSLNQGRAFATFHTINLPTGAHGRGNLAIVVHELTHVYQYERTGSQYLGQAIHAQATIGYGYGGAAGLRSDRAAGRHYRDYNREQQAQIAQDYYQLLQTHGDTSDYDPFIAELRAGDL